MPGFDESVPPVGEFVATVTGEPLIADRNTTDGCCRRCRRKNAIRRELGRDDLVRDPGFEDGSRVRLHARRPPATAGGDGWEIVAAYHLDHPHRPRADAVEPDRDQIQATATLSADGWVYPLNSFGADYEWVEEALLVREVTVEWFSPASEGSHPEGDPSDAVEEGVTVLAPEDPRPNWPASENEWRERLVRAESGT